MGWHPGRRAEAATAWQRSLSLGQERAKPCRLDGAGGRLSSGQSGAADRGRGDRLKWTGTDRQVERRKWNRSKPGQLRRGRRCVVGGLDFWRFVSE